MRALLLALLAGVVLSGCASWRSIQAQASHASYHNTETVWHPDGRIVQTTRQVEAQGSVAPPGAGGKDFATGAATANAEGASGGGATGQGFTPTTSKAVLYWIGGGFVLLGVGVGYLASVVVGILLGVIGIGIMALPTVLETYPWAPLVVGGLFLAAIVVAIVQVWRGKLKMADLAEGLENTKTALTTVISGVEGTDAQTQETTKDSIATVGKETGTYDTTKAVVSEVKATL